MTILAVAPLLAFGLLLLSLQSFADMADDDDEDDDEDDEEADANAAAVVEQPAPLLFAVFVTVVVVVVRVEGTRVDVDEYGLLFALVLFALTLLAASPLTLRLKVVE